ncbi:MAG TPA: magnesium transporter, partial [Usitatibacter sp.]|nr:magnesium transporter [Usitatibacter sp.]
MTPPQEAAELAEPSPTPNEQLHTVAGLLARRRDEEAPHDDAAVAREVHALINALHPADVAYILEGLPLEDRIFVWRLVPRDQDGDILLEV